MANDDQWRTEQRYDGTTYYVNRETGDRLTYESQEFGPAEAVIKDEFGNVKASGSVAEGGFDLKDRDGNSVYRVGAEFDGYNHVPTLRDSSGSFLGLLGGGFLGSILNPFRWFDDSSDASSGSSSGSTQRDRGNRSRDKGTDRAVVSLSGIAWIVGTVCATVLISSWAATFGVNVSRPSLPSKVIAAQRDSSDIQQAAYEYYKAKVTYRAAVARGDKAGKRQTESLMKLTSERLANLKKLQESSATRR